jgi:sugar lactone lactonase YvrE
MTSVDILYDCRLELAEGPTWDARSARLIWVDILTGSVYQGTLNPNGQPQHITLDTHVGAALPSEVDGELLLCVRDGFARLTIATEEWTPVASPLADRPLSRFNDAKSSPDGRAFGGTMPYRAGDESAHLFRLDPGPRAVPVVDGLALSNGIGWSPDGRQMYLIDSAAATLLTCPYDGTDGAVGPVRALIEFDLPAGCMPDGMCVDDDGSLWIALWGCSELRRYSPDGRLDGRVALPVSQPTSACFAGERGDTLVITSASYGLDAGSLAREPHAGSVFAFDAGVTGPPASLWNPDLIGL